MEDLKETAIEFADRVASEMIMNLDFEQQNQVVSQIKLRLTRDREDHIAQSKQALIDLKKLK